MIFKYCRHFTSTYAHVIRFLWTSRTWNQIVFLLYAQRVCWEIIGISPKVHSLLHEMMSRKWCRVIWNKLRPVRLFRNTTSLQSHWSSSVWIINNNNNCPQWWSDALSNYKMTKKTRLIKHVQGSNSCCSRWSYMHFSYVKMFAPTHSVGSNYASVLWCVAYHMNIIIWNGSANFHSTINWI